MNPKEAEEELKEFGGVFGAPFLPLIHYIEPLHQRVINHAGGIGSVSYERALADLFGDWITISTRRLRLRPAILSLEATGRASP